jgi:hypothetical protein
MFEVRSRLVLVLFGPEGKQELAFRRVHHAGESASQVLFYEEEELERDDA